MNSNYSEWLAEHRRAVMSLYDMVSELRSSSLTVPELGEILAEINQIKSDVADIYSDMLNVMSNAMGDSDLVILENGATIEKKYSKDRKTWRHKDLASAVAERVDMMSVDMETGERLLSHREVAEKMLEFVQPSYWRVGALDTIGITADDFCEVGESKANVVLRKPKAGN